MLKSLSIKNFAISDDLNIDFSNSFNVFTGETGAGKSVIINALNFVLGSRTSSETIKTGREYAEVKAEFYVNDDDVDAIKQFALGGKISVYRKIDAQGRGKAKINNNSVTISKLAELGELLVDFHGQHDNQSLLKAANHLTVLDKFGGFDALLKKVADCFELHKRAEEKIAASKMDAQEKARLLDLYTYQLNEIESLDINVEKDLKLEAELPKLRNREKLLKICAEADACISDEDNGVLTRLYQATRLLQQLCEIDESTTPALDKANEAAVLLEDVNSFLGDYAAQSDLGQISIDDIILRHDKLSKLKNKYGPQLSDVLAYAADLANKIDDLQNSGFKEKQLQKELEDCRKNLLEACQLLHESRRKAAKKLAFLVCRELAPLGFNEIKFDISVEMDDTNINSHGADSVEFLFSSNPGQPLKPLKNIGSGGELSRVMLGLKAVLNSVDNIPVLVFDEIDSGIGGEIGLRVGEKIAKISSSRQVLCVTHLPQVAGYAKAHYSVEKNITKNTSSVSVTKLNKEERVTELARMMGGLKDSANAVKHARELLEKHTLD